MAGISVEQVNHRSIQLQPCLDEHIFPTPLRRHRRDWKVIGGLGSVTFDVALTCSQIRPEVR
ncbi:hypothetical protein AWC22_21300 [Mycobacterium riyadhense]|uniref:Uncharacterized protein n=1 Tax=Mycobacterium riyadhense TaxID=486698 RepID=A0A1X2CKN2_9MYCO|nr:hypothetical protein AWC22_21300 [Mycobacterium riyadhense]